MLRVTVELLPLGMEKPQNLGTLLIVNEGTGSASLGNYKARVYRPHKKPITGREMWLKRIATRASEIWGWPRQEKPVWSLVAEALKELGYASKS